MRVPPVPTEERTPEQRVLLAVWSGDAAVNVFATLVRHTRLFQAWSPFAYKLLFGTEFPLRLRELVILRVAWRCHSTYEWSSHVPTGRREGFTDEQIRRIATADLDGWAEEDQLVLRAVDELTLDHRISDETWRGLASWMTEVQMLELPQLIGGYAMLAGTLNSFGVECDGPVIELGSARPAES